LTLTVMAYAGSGYVKSLAGGRLEAIEGAGHFVDMERPRELAQLVAGFLRA
jgi:pimeloyl-ACP methyl ester carboxylesterase